MSEDNTPDPVVIDTPPAPVVEEEGPKLYSQEYVDALRREAAGHRVGKKTAVETAVAEADSAWTEKFTAADALAKTLQTDLGESWIELEKVYQAVDAGVPHDRLRAFVGTVKGSDQETIAASVESNKSLFGITPVVATDPTQGAGGRPPIPLNSDKLLAAVEGALKGKLRV